MPTPPQFAGRRAAVAAIAAAGLLVVGPAGCKKEDAPAAASAAPAAPAAAARPAHAIEGVTFACPAGWKVQPDGNGVVAVGPQDGEWEPNVALRVHPNPEDRSVDALLGEGQERVSRKPDFESKGIRSPIEQAAGLPFGRLAYLSKAEGKTEVSLAHWYGVVLLPDKRWLEVQASTAAETRDKYEPVFQALVDSMRVKK